MSGIDFSQFPAELAKCFRIRKCVTSTEVVYNVQWKVNEFRWTDVSKYHGLKSLEEAKVALFKVMAGGEKPTEEFITVEDLMNQSVEILEKW